MAASSARDNQAAPPAPSGGSAAGASSLPCKSVAIVLACAWISALAVLAFTQANPVTLNRDQILRSEVVVAARIDSVADGTATVEQQWRDRDPLSAITILNLQETAASNGDTYILPLERGRSGYKVVAAHVPDRPYLVYPATESTLEQLEQLLPPRE